MESFCWWYIVLMGIHESGETQRIEGLTRTNKALSKEKSVNLSIKLADLRVVARSSWFRSVCFRTRWWFLTCFFFHPFLLFGEDFPIWQPPTREVHTFWRPNLYLRVLIKCLTITARPWGSGRYFLMESWANLLGSSFIPEHPLWVDRGVLVPGVSPKFCLVHVP